MKYGLIGEKLSHSFSKEVHSLIASYEYEIREIAREDLDLFMQNKDFLAINVTIPYKEAVIPYLDGISEEAKSIGAVNTIVNRDGKLYGYNTDFLGMTSLLAHINITVENKKAIILGSGGTSKTARAVFQHLGASEIITVGRIKKDGVIDYAELYKKHTDADIIVNTTPVGMYPNNYDCPVDLSNFTNLDGVVDAIYNPIRTNLILEAQKRGIKAIGGLYMLVAQAVFASEIFQGIKYDTDTLDKIYYKIKADKENIVLSGMPSCGKSTIGAILAKRLNRRLTDTDSEIIISANKSIPEIFKDDGEEAFRELETRIIANTSLQNSSIISTGGGSVLREKNVNALKQNGIIFFIDRSPDKLTPTDDRPLSSDKSAIIARYNERYDIYKGTSDYTVNGDLSAEEVANEIIWRFTK